MVWKRHDIFQMFINSFHRLREVDVDLICCAAGSEGEVSRKLCQDNGIHYIETLNQPLGKKANTRLQFTKKFDPDYVIFLGSDDIMSTQTLLRYITWANLGYDLINPLDIYFFDNDTKSMLYCKGYDNHRIGEPLAVGRMAHKSLLDQLGWKLWNDNTRLGLDGHSKKLCDISKKQKIFKLKDEGLFICDIKGKESISKFQKRSNNEYISNAELKNHLTEEEIKIML